MPKALPRHTFKLPSFVLNETDEDGKKHLTEAGKRLEEIYDAIVYNLKEEAEGVPMGTIQHLLLERIAYNYVLLRWREENVSNAGFEHSKYAREANSFWLSMTDTFTRQVKSYAGDDSAVQLVMRQLEAALVSAFDGLHPDVADPLKDRFAAALSANGL